MLQKRSLAGYPWLHFVLFFSSKALLSTNQIFFIIHNIRPFKFSKSVNIFLLQVRNSSVFKVKPYLSRFFASLI